MAKKLEIQFKLRDPSDSASTVSSSLSLESSTTRPTNTAAATTTTTPSSSLPSSSSTNPSGSKPSQRTSRKASKTNPAQSENSEPASSSESKLEQPHRGRRSQPGRKQAPLTQVSKDEANEAKSEDLKSASIASSSSSSSPLDSKSSTRQHKGSVRSRRIVHGIDPNHTELASALIQKIVNDNIECMICYENVGRRSVIWSCDNCYAIFHISCIKKWSQKSEQDWRCPGCQFQYTSPPSYLCFCRKTLEPTPDPYQLPHSCGTPCGRYRKNGLCPHPCKVLCHPGSCPPCGALTPPKPCFCGETTYQARCGEQDIGRTCNRPCNKLLPCKIHRCTQPCHEGDCGKCQIMVEQMCYCGVQKRLFNCGEGTFDSARGAWYSCDKVCGNALDCKNHTCTQICHSGVCKPCVSSPSATKNCPCGKKSQQSLGNSRTSCLDLVLTCGAPCGKRLSCGIHTCPTHCHTGPCEPCKQERTITCRCGCTKGTFTCTAVMEHEASVKSGAYQATTSSSSSSSSSSSRASSSTASSSAQQSANIPPSLVKCERLCTSLRSCGRHQCAIRCCPSMQNKSDPMGLHVCRLRCGRRLKCGNHDCDLSCHKGPCGKCPIVSFDDIHCRCGKTVLMSPIHCGTPFPHCPYPCVIPYPCGHENPHECHTEATNCRICAVFVPKPCQGGHGVLVNVPCHVQNVSCGMECGRIASCGVHKCPKACHGLKCFLPERAGQSCGQKCGKARTQCEHTCKQLCHTTQPCPDIPCDEPIQASCPCGNQIEKVACQDGRGKVSVQCNTRCEVIRRNRLLGEALGIDGGGIPIYEEALIEIAANDPVHVEMTESTLAKFVMDAQVKALTLPPMNRNSRELFHRLAKYYFVDVQSVDAEPNRGIIIRKTPSTHIPEILLSKAKDSPLSHISFDETPHILHIPSVPSQTTTADIEQFLTRGARLITAAAAAIKDLYQIVWMDKTSAVILFKSVQVFELCANDHVLMKEGILCPFPRRKISRLEYEELLRQRQAKLKSPAIQKRSNVVAADWDGSSSSSITSITSITSQQQQPTSSTTAIISSDPLTSPSQSSSSVVDDWEALAE